MQANKNRFKFSFLLRMIIGVFMTLVMCVTYAADCNAPTVTYPGTTSCSFSNFATNATQPSCTTAGVVTVGCNTNTANSGCSATVQCTSGACTASVSMNTNAGKTAGTYNGSFTLDDPCTPFPATLSPSPTYSFIINKASQTITIGTPAPASAGVGTNYTVNATASSTLPVTVSIDPTSTPGACTNIGQFIQFTGLGSCVINANQAGNTNYNAAPQIQQTVTVVKGNQTINFTSTAPTNPQVGSTYTPTATASPSGLTVVFTIDASTAANCSISGGVVTYTAAGLCTVDANQPGNTNYNAAPQVQQSTTAVKISQTIAFTSTAPTNPAVGSTYTPTATASPSGLPVTFTIDAATAGNCTISGGVVTFTAAGLCTIDANQAGNATYSAAPQVQQSTTSVKTNQTITFTSTPPANPTVNSTYTPTATATPSGLPVTFTIDASTAGNCSISGGTVTFTAAAPCTINANQAGNATYNAAPQVQQQITNVGKADQTIIFTSPIPPNPTVNSTYTPTAIATPSGLTVTFTIDASSSANCSITGGVVTFTNVGSCIVNANQAGNANYNPAPQVQQNITVIPANQTISFSTTAPTNPPVGTTYTPAATATSGLPVSFSIDASTAANCTISGGVVTYTAVGTCILDANQSGDADYNPAPQVQQTSTVIQGSQTITITTSVPSNPPVGTTYTPTATGGGSGNPVVFTIDPASTPGACSISGGVVSFLSVGTCIIDANQNGDPNYNPAPQVQQTATVTKASQTIVITSQPPTAPVVGGQYVITSTGGSSGNPVVYTIDPASTPDACTISGNVVSFTGTGTCIVDANQAGGPNYDPAPQIQQTFTIAFAPEGSITIVKQAVGRNGTFTFTSTIPGAGVLSLSTSNGSAQHTYSDLPIDTYNVRETDLPPGWELTNVQCNGVTMDPNAVNVTLSPGSNVTCVFTNTFDEAMVRQKTLQSIATFINHRAHLMLAAAPDRRRIVQILSKTLQAAPAAQPVLSDGRMGMRMSASLGGLEQALTPRNLDFWTQVQVDYFNLRQGNFNRDRAQFGLVYAGADYLYSDRLLLGALVQFDLINEKNLLRSNIHASGHGWMAGPYLSARLLPDLYFHSRMAFGTSNNKIDPFHFQNDIFQTFRQLYNAEVMGNFMLLNALRVAPTLGVTWFNERQGRYINTLDVDIPSQNLSLGQLNVGPELGYPLYTSEQVAALLRVSVQAIYNFQETGYLLLIPANSLSTFYGRINLGADIMTNKNISLYPMVVWDGVGGNFETVGGQIQIRANLDD